MTDNDFDAIALHMRDDIRERIHADIAPCTQQDFLAAYLAADPDFPIHQFKTSKGEHDER